MANIINDLMNSPYIWVILSVCTLLGVLSLIYAIITRSYKEISYYHLKQNVIANNLEKIVGLECRFRGTTINSISVIRVILWNSGNDCIDNNEIIRPISVSVIGDGKILGTEIVKYPEESNCFQFSIEDGSLNITF